MHAISGPSSAVRIFVFLLVWTVLTHYSVDASLWSSVKGETDQVEGIDNENDNGNEELVSPIVNREIKVSVKAPWPSSSKITYSTGILFFCNSATISSDSI